jgi:hypothetical protein
MDTITVTDLFFIITGVAIIIITTLIVVALLYIIFFIRAVRAVVNQAQRAGEMITDDLKDFGKNIKQQGFSLRSLITFLFGLKAKQNKRKK